MALATLEMVQEQLNGWKETYPSTITEDVTNCILEDGYYLIFAQKVGVSIT